MGDGVVQSLHHPLEHLYVHPSGLKKNLAILG